VRYRTLLSFLFLTALVGVAAEAPAPKDVDITAVDGLKLRGTYSAAAKPGPGVLLLHMCNTDRKSWAPLVPQLVAAGINVLAVDNRGFGESGAVPDATPQQQAEARKLWPSDFDADFAYLLAQPGVDKNRIGIAGGSCGVDNAVQTARRHPGDVKSLVLLAGGTDGNGIQFLRQNAWLPLFTAAAADDQYDPNAPQTMKWFAEFSGNPRNKFMGFPDGKHGTEIFPVHPELPKAITAWFVDTLIKSPADAKGTMKVKHTPVSDFWAALESPGGTAKAVEIYHQAKQQDPKAYLFPEAVLNVVAYGRMQAGQNKDAIELAKLNVEAYPDSANTYDSLSDMYLADGQNEKALEAAKKCIAMLPADKGNAQFKEFVRQSAEGKVKKLEAAK
jgi:pimeloyl-ACP methyl ester carboxylesterase